jgi:hypothetical protein
LRKRKLNKQVGVTGLTLQEAKKNTIKIKECWLEGKYATKKCVHMYANAKMIPAKTTPGIRIGG